MASEMILEQVKLEDLQFTSCQLIQFLFYQQISCTMFMTPVSVIFLLPLSIKKGKHDFECHYEVPSG